MSGAIMLASERGEVGLAAAMELLRGDGRAIDAVELAVRAAEANPDDHYVGIGGIPNILGVLELDASIMDGRTRAAGAVGAVRGFPHPISIARKVLEELPQHLLLVGEGAERFAREQGFNEEDTLTEEALRLWRDGLSEPSWHGADSEGDRRYRETVLERLRASGLPDGQWGTVNILALDRHGDLCVGVSTSGYPWKHPGRLGDSPLIGAGNYCDNRAGAAACTGRGELAIRAGTARAAVAHLAAGLSPEEACLEALRDAAVIPDDFRAPLMVLALAPDGRHGGAGTRPGATYAVMTEEMTDPEISPEEDGVKIFVSSDIEGTAGIVDWQQVIGPGPEYELGRRLLLDEVNAAIDGAFDAGAIAVVVNDAHWTMQNLPPGELRARAQYISGKHKPLYMMEGLDDSFDAVFLVAYHGSIGAERAVLSHTYNPNAISEVRLNGEVVGESGVNALVALHHGVPVALVTGDAVTAEEAQRFMPGIECVVVKESVSRFAARSLHPDEACELIRDGARRALERLPSLRPPAIDLPARLEVTLVTADMAEQATWIRGVERNGIRSVAAEDDDPLRLYRAFAAIVAVTRTMGEW